MNLQIHKTLDKNFQAMLGVPDLDNIFKTTKDTDTELTKDFNATSKELFAPINLCNSSFMSLLETLWAHYESEVADVLRTLLDKLKTLTGRQDEYTVDVIGKQDTGWILRLYTDPKSPLQSLCNVHDDYSHKRKRDFRAKYRIKTLESLRLRMVKNDIQQMQKMQEREMFLRFGDRQQYMEDEFKGVPMALFDTKPRKDGQKLTCPPTLLPYFELGARAYSPDSGEEINKMQELLARFAQTNDFERARLILLHDETDDPKRYKMQPAHLPRSQISTSGHADELEYEDGKSPFKIEFPSFFTSTFFIQLKNKDSFAYKALRDEIIKAIEKIQKSTSEVTNIGDSGNIKGTNWTAVFPIADKDNQVKCYPVGLMCNDYGCQAYVDGTQGLVDEDFNGVYVMVFMYGPLMMSRLRRINTSVTTNKGQGYQRCRFAKSSDFAKSGVSLVNDAAFVGAKNELLMTMLKDELRLVKEKRFPGTTVIYGDNDNDQNNGGDVGYEMMNFE